MNCTETAVHTSGSGFSFRWNKTIFENIWHFSSYMQCSKSSPCNKCVLACSFMVRDVVWRFMQNRFSRTRQLPIYEPITLLSMAMTWACVKDSIIFFLISANCFSAGQRAQQRTSSGRRDSHLWALRDYVGHEESDLGPRNGWQEHAVVRHECAADLGRIGQTRDCGYQWALASTFRPFICIKQNVKNVIYIHPKDSLFHIESNLDNSHEN